MRLSSLAAACALLAAASPAAAQITVTGIRNLAFGPVIRGVATHVFPNDAVKSGQFRFVTAIGNTVRLNFTLPNRLNGPSGATMPISFGTTDAFALGSGPTSVPVTFNPNNTQTFNIVTSTTINVFIGATVTPAAAQTLGAYSNTITFTVIVL
ncbi:MAG TPA: hypothetical protein VIG08_00120 [Gemmatimonadales bacterium]|jgi:hypothetical protein